MALYDAFVSYSHAKDKPIAAALQSVIQKLGKPWYRRRALRLFRDDTSLSATPGLWPTIEQALGQSRYLILLASPEAAASPWVNMEVAWWLDHKSPDTLLIAVTEGALAWDNTVGDFTWREGMPLPPVLTGRFASEPKWVDLTAYRDAADTRDAKFTELAADFASAIHGMPKEDLLSQEVRQQRRALRLAWSAAGSLLVLAVAAGGAGVLAYHAQQKAVAAEQQAVAERDTATRNFKLAQKTAESLVFDIAQGLRDVQGVSTETVHKILETARGTFEQLAASAPDDLSLQRSRGAMLDQFGDTYFTLGDLSQALTAYRDSLAIAERLTGADRGNTEWQRDLSVAYDKVGYVLAAQGKLEEALTAYRDSFVIAERLAATDRSNAGWQRDLSISHQRVGNVLVAQGKLEEALTAYRDGLAIMERVAAADRNNTQWQRELSIAYIKVGDVLVAQGKLDEALKAYHDSFAIFDRLAAADRSNTQWQRDLSVSYDRVGDVLKAQGKLDEALKAFRDGLAIRERLAAADPSNKQWQHDLFVSHERVGDVLLAQSKLDEALKAYRDGLAIAERLAAGDASNTGWQRDLSVSYNKVGDVLVKQGKLDEALKAYRDSLTIAERLAVSDRSNTLRQRDLSVSYEKVGNMLVAQGNLDEALKAYREALVLAERLAAADRNNAQWQEEFQISVGKIGNMAYRFLLADNFTKALEVADEAIEFAPQKIWLYTNRAHALMLLGRVDEARALYLRYRGEKNVQDDKTWETVVLEDFAELRKAGITHPLMDEIEAKFNARG